MATTNQIVDAEVSHAPAATNVTSESAILEVIDRRSEHHQIYPPMFNSDEKSAVVSEILSAGKSADLLASGAAA